MGGVRENDENVAKRVWLGIGVASVVLLASYSSLLVAIVAAGSDTPDAAGPAFALGFSLVPIVYVVAAFVSGRERAPSAVLKAMGLWIITALPLSLFNPVFGLCAGFGVGGIVTLRRQGNSRWLVRLGAVFAVSAYALIMLWIIPALGFMSGGLLPLAAIGIADYYTEQRAASSIAG